MRSFLRIFGFSAGATLAIWAGVAFGLGWAGFVSCVILTILEVTFSFDNAVVNAKLLGFMSPWWQKFFMTFGIFIAVFVVRFALPVLIVSITSGHGFIDVLNLAVDKPEEYGHELEKAGPAIASFGGVFLLMIALGFFLDAVKDVHWFHWLEERLSRLGRYDNVAIFVLIVVTIVIAATVHGTPEERFVILIAGASGIALNVGLGIFGAAVEGDDNAAPTRVRVLVGMAAFVMFIRLEVLDASFSFDGVIGAFAISSNVFIIMAGLGAGALWVRSLTVYLVRQGTLAKYRYLEHGAHWAIGALGVVMLIKVYGIELPEWLTGSIGLVFIAMAVLSSIRHRKRTLVHA
jgi:hypothetical protein